MTREETQKVLEVLRVAYPKNYRGMSKTEMMQTISLYHSRFKDYPSELVAEALNAYIDENEFPPTIAGIKKYITRFGGERDYEAMWNELWQGICGNRKFTELCKPNQKYIGSQRVLDDIGADERTVMEVVKGQYMRRIAEIVENEKFERQLERRVGIGTTADLKAKARLEGITAKLLESKE